MRSRSRRKKGKFKAHKTARSPGVSNSAARLWLGGRSFRRAVPLNSDSPVVVPGRGGRPGTVCLVHAYGHVAVHACSGWTRSAGSCPRSSRRTATRTLRRHVVRRELADATSRAAARMVLGDVHVGAELTLRHPNLSHRSHHQRDHQSLPRGIDHRRAHQQVQVRSHDAQRPLGHGPCQPPPPLVACQELRHLIPTFLSRSSTSLRRRAVSRSSR